MNLYRKAGWQESADDEAFSIWSFF